MTDEQKAALEWLERLTEFEPLARTLKALLAEPRLPVWSAQEAGELIKAMRSAIAESDRGPYLTAEAAYRALYAFLSGPKDQLEEIRRFGT